MSRRGERGSATVLSVAVVVTILAAGSVSTAVTAAVAARHRAAVAADAGALAAASRVQDGPVAACALAARVARADGAHLTRCGVAGAVATVTVEVRLPLLLRWQGAARLNARAGPADTYREKPLPVAVAS